MFQTQILNAKNKLFIQILELKQMDAGKICSLPMTNNKNLNILLYAS